jgi:type II secretory pathway pseudopilin PulG
MPNKIQNQKSETLPTGRQVRNLKGFSIIELIFAMSFLTIVVFAVISLQTSNVAMANSQKNQIQANFYASQGVQILKSLGYDSSLSGCLPDTCKKKLVFDSGSYALKDYTYGTVGPEKIKDAIFERHIEIDSTSLNNAYKAVVCIEWEDSTGVHRKIVDGKEENADVEAKIIISS